MTDKKMNEVWVTQQQIDEHIKGFGRPGYDEEKQCVKGKTKLFEVLERNDASTSAGTGESS